MSRKRKCSLFLIFLSTISTFLYSQVWIARYNGEASLDDCATALAVDEQENVYITGYSYRLSNKKSYLTIKYNPNGETLWTRRYEGFSDSEAKNIIIDSENNIYVTGWSDGENTQRDILTIKYNCLGDTLWTRRYNGSDNQDDEPTKMVIDSRNNIYVTGFSFSNGSNYDYVTIKYNQDGIERWVRTYNGLGDSTDISNSVSVDREGNVYITGVSYGLGTKGDFATIKYDTLGNLIWVTIYNDTTNIFDDEAIGIGLDSFYNIYVAGISDFDSLPGSGLLTFTIIKYNSSGEKRWITKSFPGAGADLISDMTVDHNGNVYVTGTDIWWNTHRNYKTEMYDSSGQRLWVAGYDADSLHDFSCAVAVDNLGNVYITGKSETHQKGYDYATIKYNINGIEQWVARYNGPGDDDDEAIAITIDRIGNIYVTGRSKGINTAYDYCTIKYLPSGPDIEEPMLSNPEQFTLEINPSPATSVIRVRCPLSVKEIKIFDVSGKLVKEIASASPRNDRTEEVKISLKGINPGIYFLRPGKETKKFIVTK